MNISLEELQAFLRADQAEGDRKQAAQYRFDRQTLPIRQAIRKVWQRHGVLEPIEGVWMRPIPDNLYQCPLSHPQTSLVCWNTLAAPVQAQISHLKPANETDVVEIPFVLLQPEKQGTNKSVNGGHSRPLNGNLSDKLSEYTRGVAGQSRPFLPGGVDDDDAFSNVEDPYRTPEAIQRAHAPLKNGIEKSWQDGTLITAPPGVSFKVGLSWQNLHSDVDGSETKTSANVVAAESEVKRVSRIDDVGYTRNDPQESATNLSTTMGTFDRSFFDDDSLFASSGEDSAGEFDSGDDSSDEGQNASASTLREEIMLEASKKEGITAADVVTDTERELDDLLRDLTASGNGATTRKKIVGHTTMANALHLAVKGTEHQTDATRKTWASTKVLPIRDFIEWVPNPAMTFPFILDGFQQQAVVRLERSESVFVAAHTSAGKTVVAEYAVALAKQRGTRCVYTSPIKALSNQKFRDFSLKFGAENIGLITGDLQVNADDSTCLIMTTEILRSMLYRGADLVRDIEFVVFDEVHYVNDTERGVVWEEVIIMLPSYVNLIFLSATTPNTLEFSDWIGRTKRKPVFVIKTDYRPVPLSFNLWAGLKLHTVMEGRDGFLERGFASAANALLPASARDSKKTKSESKGRPPAKTAIGSKQMAWQAQGTKQNWMSLVRFLDRENMTPTVVFSFSKKKCEEISIMLQSLDLNTAKERGAVQGFTLQTVARLSKNDSNLPQVVMVCEMVQRGIGIHHGGLLPILKEMVEILFAKSLVKILFATETFAMGVNMPARSVVFNSVRKHDGKQFRQLEPGEITQMAGRAGRRGLDKVGTVIICCFGETPPPQQMLKQMLTGSSTRLNSRFRLTYNMILNLLRVEEMSVESMIKRSFSEFATQRALTTNDFPQLLTRGIRALEKLEETYKVEAASRIGSEDVEEYFSTCSEILSITELLLTNVRDTEAASFEGILQKGRIVLISACRELGAVRAPALVLKSPSLSSKLTPNVNARTDRSNSKEVLVVCLVLLPSSYIACQSDINKKPGTVGYVGLTRSRHFSIRKIRVGQILLVSSQKCNVDTTSILREENRCLGDPRFNATSFLAPAQATENPFAEMKTRGKKGASMDNKRGSGTAKADEEVEKVLDSLMEAERAELCDSGVPLLDLRDFLKRGDSVLRSRQLFGRLEAELDQMRNYEIHRHPSLESMYSTVERKESLRSKVNTLRHLLSNESLQLFPDFLQRKAVLRKLGYIDEKETVSIKGRVACETNTCEELIVTELVFEGLLNELDPEEIVAVLSALVFQEKGKETSLSVELPERLIVCCEQMKTIALNLGRIQKDVGLDIDPAEYSESSLNFGLVHVVYEWALGVPFKSICDLTDVQEGSIVRSITRLDELCREVRNCARVVGNPTLYRKLEAASMTIKRDIVFASSLYVS